MGVRNMGNPHTLSDFILWAGQQFPAERYALIIWDHGVGWPAALLDQSAHDELTLPDLSQALNDARLAGGPQFLDVIGFDAGLMAQWEMFDAIAPYGGIAIASEEAVPATGWDYTAILAALRASPAMDGRALAEQIAQVYISYYAITNPHPYVTLSAVQLADIGLVTDALSDLVDRPRTGQRQPHAGPECSAQPCRSLFRTRQPGSTACHWIGRSATFRRSADRIDRR